MKLSELTETQLVSALAHPAYDITLTTIIQRAISRLPHPGGSGMRSPSEQAKIETQIREALDNHQIARTLVREIADPLRGLADQKADRGIVKMLLDRAVENAVVGGLKARH